jgi:predicted lipoprotein with Yx(FWY)xxD motif
MWNWKRTPLIVVSCLAVTVGIAACGSDDETTSASAGSTQASGSSGDVAVADSDLGQILVGSDGMTIYLFEKDTSADASTCSGACAQAWPPVTANGPVAGGDGVEASKLTTLKRDDGSSQIAYNGHPLYYYAGDSAPGDTNGNNVDQFGAEWYAMTSAGDAVSNDAGSSDDSDSGSAAGDYSY